MAKKNNQPSATRAESHGYKDSPLGRIPEEWNCIGLLNACDLINGRAFKPKEWTEDGIPIVRIENLNNGDACFNYCNFKVPGKYLLQTNDLLISWSGTPGTSFGIFIWNRGKAVLNQHIFKVILNDGIDKKYFFYAYKNLLAEMIRQSHGGVGLQHITKEDLKRLEFLIPPHPEQSAIASILSTLDEAIEKTDRLIAKYKRIKQGLMQDLFRYGIDENGRIRSEQTHRFKDSPLGRIPEEWEVDSLSNVCSLIKDGTHLPPKRVNDGVWLLGVTNIVAGNLTLTKDDTKVSEEFYQQMHKNWNIQANDVLLAIVGATIGKVTQVPKVFPKFTLQRSVCLLRGKTGILYNDFLRIFIESERFQRVLWNEVNVTAQPGIYLATLGKFLIVKPSYEEQYRITSTIDTLNKLLSVNEVGLAKFQSIKRGLMEDLLTGKVRVPASLMEEISHA